MELYDWYKKVLDGKINDARRNMSVVLLDDEGQEFVRWDFTEAWPCRYSPPDLYAMDNGVALETFEIAYEIMVRA
jgi:phage tail-like protein